MANVVKQLSKWDQFGTSIFSQMTQRANAAAAINLAQGFPDFDGPDVLKEAAIEAIRSGHNQYAPMAGLSRLRELLARRQAKKYALAYDPVDEVTVYSGATEAIFCAFQAFLEAGDEIIALEPFYDSYAAAAYAAGARLVGVPLRPPQFDLDVEALEKAWTPRTKAIMVNTPHNPTGHVLSEAERRAICDFAIRRDLVVVTDEVYEELVYEPHAHVPLATLSGMRDRTAVISSTSKTFSMTGWKVGYCFAPPLLTKAMRTVHQFTVFCSATPLQHAMIAALELGDDYYSELRASYRARRDLLTRLLREAGFSVAEAQGSYFVLADYAARKDLPDVAFCQWLTSELKVAAIPISVFYTDVPKAARELRYARFAFCKGEDTLLEAGRRLRVPSA
jgi:N-succinyldiaminopimelate aminotransferase